jgi:hypothetical protein
VTPEGVGLRVAGTAVHNQRSFAAAVSRPFPGFAPSREGLKEAFRLFCNATPGTHQIEDQVAEGDKVVTSRTARGVHSGDLPGIPATGRETVMTATVTHRIADGKLTEKWSDKDLLASFSSSASSPCGGVS